MPITHSCYWGVALAAVALGALASCSTNFPGESGCATDSDCESSGDTDADTDTDTDVDTDSDIDGDADGDTDSVQPACGNGVVDPEEQCDGTPDQDLICDPGFQAVCSNDCQTTFCLTEVYYDIEGVAINVIATLDDNFLLVGCKQSDVDVGLMIEVNHQGQVLWSKEKRDRRYVYVDQTISGDYLIIGTDNSQAQPIGIMARFDSQGTELWEKPIGSGESLNVVSVVKTPEGHYGVMGRWFELNNSWQRYYIAKLDSNGDTLWLKHEEFHKETISLIDLALLTNGNLVTLFWWENPAGHNEFLTDLVHYNGQGVYLRSDRIGSQFEESAVGTEDGNLAIGGPTILKVDGQTGDLIDEIDVPGEVLDLHTVGRGYFGVGWHRNPNTSRESIRLNKVAADGSLDWTASFGRYKRNFPANSALLDGGKIVVAGYYEEEDSPPSWLFAVADAGERQISSLR